MNKFGHMELNTDDPQAARAFYGELFDWKIRDVPMGDGSSYILIDEIGGIHKKPMPGAPTQWIGYVTVDSLDASVARIKELGGSVFVDRMEVPGMGSFAIAADPTGGTFALWQAVPGAHGEGEKAKKKDKNGKKPSEKKKQTEKSARKSAKKAEKKARKDEKKADKAEKKSKKGKKGKTKK